MPRRGSRGPLERIIIAINSLRNAWRENCIAARRVLRNNNMCVIDMKEIGGVAQLFTSLRTFSQCTVL